MVYYSMPIYTYQCRSHGDFEHKSSMQDYCEKVKCPTCGKLAPRNLLLDTETIHKCVVLGDSDLKTLQHLGNRNRDRKSADEKHDLKHKHNDYKYAEPTKELPHGMTRLRQRPDDE